MTARAALKDGLGNGATYDHPTGPAQVVTRAHSIGRAGIVASARMVGRERIVPSVQRTGLVRFATHVDMGGPGVHVRCVRPIGQVHRQQR